MHAQDRNASQTSQEIKSRQPLKLLPHFPFFSLDLHHPMLSLGGLTLAGGVQVALRQGRRLEDGKVPATYSGVGVVQVGLHEA